MVLNTNSSATTNGKAASIAKLQYQKKRQSIDNSMIRFPKLDECAHFHYEFAELNNFTVSLIHNGTYSAHHLSSDNNNTLTSVCNLYLFVRVHSGQRSWTIRRNLQDFRFLDIHLHKCLLDRKFSQLKTLNLTYFSTFDSLESIAHFLDEYLERFSEIVKTVFPINFLKCGPVLHWFEMDNRGNRLISEESDINTPAIGAAFVIKKHNKSDVETEISLEIGELVSVIEMPPVNESFYWKGKKGLEVGFFPAECVQLIDDKISRKSDEFSLRPLNKCTSPTLRHRIVNTPSSIANDNYQYYTFNMDDNNESVMRKEGIISSLIRTIAPGRNAGRKRDQRSVNIKERVFGCDLCEHLANSSHDLPLVVTTCCKYIESKGVDSFGVYRLNGVASAISRLRSIFDQGEIPKELEEDLDFTGSTDIHAVGSLIKRYFRELPNPLFTFSLHDSFISALREDSLDEDAKILTIRNLIISLPPPHWRTLRFLIRHFDYVSQFSDKTGMTKRNLAIVWAPNLLRSRDIDQQAAIEALNVVTTQVALIDFLIRNCDKIFDREEHELNPPGPLYSPFVYPRHNRSPPLFSKCLKYIDVGPVIVPGKYHTIIANIPTNKNVKRSKFNINLKKFHFFTARNRSESSRPSLFCNGDDSCKVDSIYSTGAQSSNNFVGNSGQKTTDGKLVKRSHSFDSYFKKLRTSCTNDDACNNNNNDSKISNECDNLKDTNSPKTDLKNDTIFEVEESMLVDGVACEATSYQDQTVNEFIDSPMTNTESTNSLMEQFETYQIPDISVGHTNENSMLHHETCTNFEKDISQIPLSNEKCPSISNSSSFSNDSHQSKSSLSLTSNTSISSNKEVCLSSSPTEKQNISVTVIKVDSSSQNSVHSIIDSDKENDDDDLMIQDKENILSQPVEQLTGNDNTGVKSPSLITKIEILRTTEPAIDKSPQHLVQPLSEQPSCQISSTVDRERIEKIKEARRLEMRQRYVQKQKMESDKLESAGDYQLPDVINSSENTNSVRLRHVRPWRNSGISYISTTSINVPLTSNQDSKTTIRSISSGEQGSQTSIVANVHSSPTTKESTENPEQAKIRYRITRNVNKPETNTKETQPKITVKQLQTINKRQRITDNQTLVQMFENNFQTSPDS